MQPKGQTRAGHSGEMDMTSGPLWKKIMIFSLPLMASQLLQVLFNMADVAVVGRFASAYALGSVGSTTILVTLFTGLLIGMGSGVNVLVAQSLGARQSRDTMETVHTSFVLCTLAGILIGTAGFFLAEPMLALIKTKDELIEGAVLYFRIYSLGMPALGIFNFGNAVLSAQGDTRRPLVYLTAAGIANVFLNLFFVLLCNMSVDGVAYASIISQYLSAVLVLVRMAKSSGDCKLRLREVRLYPGKTKKILILGIPAGLQNAIFAVANLFIQSAVNSFDHVMVEGNSAAANADAIIYNVMAAFYTACSTFMGQNLGSCKYKRVIKSYFVSLTYSFAAGAVLGLALLLFGTEFLSLFTTDAEVIAAGMQRVGIMSWSYMISAFMDCTIAASRGLGRSLVPTVVVILGSCVFRVAWIYTVFAHFHTIPSLYLLYVFSWTITAVAEILYFAAAYRHQPKVSAAAAEQASALSAE